MKKVLSLVLSLCVIFSLTSTAFAAYPEDSPVLNEDLNLNIDTMTSSEKVIYQDVIDAAIAQYKASDADFDEDVFIEQVNYVLYLMDNPYTSSNPDINTLAVIDLSIPNEVVATAANVVISLLVGGVTTAAIKAFVAKYGATAAANLIAKEVTAKLLALGIKELSGLGTVIRTIVKNVVDPGTTIAEWLDNRDVRPGNGYVDIVI